MRVLFLQNKGVRCRGVTAKPSLCSALQLLEKDKSSQMHRNLIRHVCLKSNCKWKRNPTLAGTLPLTTRPLTKNTLPHGWGGNEGGEARERESERDVSV